MSTVYYGKQTLLALVRARGGTGRSSEKRYLNHGTAYGCYTRLARDARQVYNETIHAQMRVFIFAPNETDE